MPSLPFDDEDLPLFTVGQVLGMLAVQQAFLRRLDSLGVANRPGPRAASAAIPGGRSLSFSMWCGWPTRAWASRGSSAFCSLRPGSPNWSGSARPCAPNCRHAAAGRRGWPNGRGDWWLSLPVGVRIGRLPAAAGSAARFRYDVACAPARGQSGSLRV